MPKKPTPKPPIIPPLVWKVGVPVVIVVFLAWFFTIGPMGPNARAMRAEEERLAALPDQREAMALAKKMVESLHLKADQNGGRTPQTLDEIQAEMGADFEILKASTEFKMPYATSAEMVDKDLIATISSRDGYLRVFWDKGTFMHLFVRSRSGAKEWIPEEKRFKLMHKMLPLDRTGKTIKP